MMKYLFRKLWLYSLSRISQFFYIIFPPNIEVLLDQILEFPTSRNDAKKRILYIALKYDYGDKKRGLSYEEYNFFYTLKNMKDIELIRFDFYSVVAKYGSNVANKILKEVVMLERFDILFCLLYKDFFDHQIISEISDNFPIETILWLFDDDKRYCETKSLVKCFNKVVTTIKIRHEERVQLGINSILAQFSANHYVYRDYALKKIYDVVFVGQNFGNRQYYVDYLKANKINVSTYGRGWSEGRLSQSKMIEIFNQSKIVLNFSSSQGQPTLKYLKGRIFEIPACGAFVLTEDCEELDDYFNVGVEVERFYDAEEIVKKVNKYLTDDGAREKIARAGKNKVLENYTFEKYFMKVFDLN